MNKIIVPIIVILALVRLIPHPPNFTPIIAVGLFGGAYLKDKRLAFLIPIFGMLIADAIIGFYIYMPFIYFSLAVIVLIGIKLNNNINIINSSLSMLSGSIIFFLVSNFGVWIIGYPKTIVGFITCYSMAIPFFHNTLLGTFFYGGLLFGGYELLSRYLSKNSIHKSI